MGIFKSLGKVLAGGHRQKGETVVKYNKRAHRAYKEDWIAEKKYTGKWLPKDEYEKKTGKPGRKD
jgi:hypothetical protein